MTKKRGRPKGEETTPVGFRAIKKELDRALILLNDKTEVCNKGLAYFNMISSEEYKIKKK